MGTKIFLGVELKNFEVGEIRQAANKVVYAELSYNQAPSPQRKSATTRTVSNLRSVCAFHKIPESKIEGLLKERRSALLGK